MLVNVDDLITALLSRDGEIEWYLDLNSGQTVPLLSEHDDPDRSLAEALESQPERFLTIAPIGSDGALAIMGAFAASLPPGKPQGRLTGALCQPRPFRHFKNALLKWPHIRKQWHRFHKARTHAIADAWLTAYSLQARLTEPKATRAEA